MIARLKRKLSDQDPTSTTPRSNSSKGLAPCVYDRVMGVPSVGSTCGEERDGEETDLGKANLGVTDDSIPNPDPSSGKARGESEVLVLWKS